MANYRNNLDGLSQYEALLVFNGLVLNGELSTLLKEKGFNYVEPRIESNANGVPEFFLIFTKEGSEQSCRVTFKETVIASSVYDDVLIKTLKGFFQLKEGIQYHIHVTRNLSKVDDTFTIRVVNCLTHDEFLSTDIAQKKRRDLKDFEHVKGVNDNDWTHFTVICKSLLVDKVKTLAKMEGFTIREVVEKFLSDGITKYECKHGHIQQLRRKQNINEVL